jgi:hypothetical protein
MKNNNSVLLNNISYAAPLPRLYKNGAAPNPQKLDYFTYPAHYFISVSFLFHSEFTTDSADK